MVEYFTWTRASSQQLTMVDRERYQYFYPSGQLAPISATIIADLLPTTQPIPPTLSYQMVHGTSPCSILFLLYHRCSLSNRFLYRSVMYKIHGFDITPTMASIRSNLVTDWLNLFVCPLNLNMDLPSLTIVFGL
ncbi:hypothetical protein LINGRAHAP2_LOCUS30442 [Linum grandiflorum]